MGKACENCDFYGRCQWETMLVHPCCEWRAKTREFVQFSISESKPGDVTPDGSRTLLAARSEVQHKTRKGRRVISRLGEKKR